MHVFYFKKRRGSTEAAYVLGLDFCATPLPLEVLIVHSAPLQAVEEQKKEFEVNSKPWVAPEVSVWASSSQSSHLQDCTTNGNTLWWWALETTLVLCLHQRLAAHIRGLGYAHVGCVYKSDIWQHWNMIRKEANKSWQMASLSERGAKQLARLCPVSANMYDRHSATDPCSFLCFNWSRVWSFNQKISINKWLQDQILIHEYKHWRQTGPSPSLCLPISALLIVSAAITKKVTFLQHKHSYSFRR